jgi:hypothetical protein
MRLMIKMLAAFEISNGFYKIDISHNSCGIGILPVQKRLFGRCLITQSVIGNW